MNKIIENYLFEAKENNLERQRLLKSLEMKLLLDRTQDLDRSIFLLVSEMFSYCDETIIVRLCALVKRISFESERQTPTEHAREYFQKDLQSLRMAIENWLASK